jgi:hypothetical protein
MTSKFRDILELTLGIYLLFPVHELGHYLVATYANAEVTEVHIFPTLTHPTPYIVVNEFTFDHLWQIPLFYLAGILITFILALLYTIFMKPQIDFNVPHLWLSLAPVVGITDLDNIFRLFGIIKYSKWMHLILGMWLMFFIVIMFFGGVLNIVSVEK